MHGRRNGPGRREFLCSHYINCRERESIIKKISKIGATRCQILRLKCTEPRGSGDLAVEPLPKHALANCCCHLGNKNEELAGLATAIALFGNLLISWYY